jgi:hypothetical protein
MSVTKRFDKELYEANDTKAKKAIKSILKGTKYSVKESENRMAVDLELFKNEELVGYIECESKKAFKGKFQYDTLQIPERKRKYAVLDKPTLFVVFDCNFNNYMVVTNKDLLKSNVVEVPNKYCFKEELFFQVPIKKVSTNNLVEVLNNCLE